MRTNPTMPLVLGAEEDEMRIIDTYLRDLVLARIRVLNACKPARRFIGHRHTTEIFAKAVVIIAGEWCRNSRSGVVCFIADLLSARSSTGRGLLLMLL